MEFLKTLFTGYRLMYQDLTTKHNDFIPRCLTGCGTGLMMIGSAVMAKTAMTEDVQQVISEANAAVDEVKNATKDAKKPEKVKKIFVAKVHKGLKVAKAFRKGIIIEAVGGACVGTGYGMAESGKHRALKAVGAVGAAFAAYRANVREDLGDEADRRYLTGQRAVRRIEKVNRKTGEITQELEYVEGDGSITIQKDPNAFRFWFSEETCPSLYFSNRDLTIANLRSVEDTLSLKLQGTGHISLNDMRREFGGLNPAKMDVGIGGIFGRIARKDIPLIQNRVNLHFKEDKDFIEGRTDGCWIIFDCDPDPIIGRIGKKVTQVER